MHNTHRKLGHARNGKQHALTLALVMLVGVLLALSSASSTRADDADARVQAAAHWKKGVEQANAHAYAAALAEFEAAYALVQHAAVLYNIALAQIGLDRPAAAVVTLRRYLSQPAEAGDAKRKAAEATLSELEAKLASAPATQLTIVVFPYGKVWLDGRLLGNSPLTIAVPQGPHEISGGRETPTEKRPLLVESQPQRLVLAWARQDLITPTP